MNLRNIPIYIFFFFFTNQSIQAQCETQCDWLYQDLDPLAYNCLDNNVLELYYCENTLDVIYAPDIYIEGVWEYSTEGGQICQDWDWIGENIVFSIDPNDPCLANLTDSKITVTFTGYTSEDESIPPETCVFDLIFYELPDPFIEIENYNTDEQIVICEDNLVTLTANGLGSENIENTSIQWYLNGNEINEGTDFWLDIENTNYDVNSTNVFSFTVSNYCSQLNEQEAVSDWLTISIYEGYDECEPCAWDLPDYEKNQVYGFTPNNDGENDFFPEKPNNEENRSPETMPTCEATKYRISIYNRLGRELFKSDYDNHPWDGTQDNGKKCKDGVYYYKMEYVLNPFITDYNQDETKTSTGTVYLDSGN